MDGRVKGSITVFSTLILSVLISFLLVCLESAYRSVQKSVASAMCEVATESLFADYFLPLYEEYHVFGVYEQAEELSERYEEYLECMTNLNPWKLGVKDSSIGRVSTLTDNCGEAFRRQAVEFEKLEASKDILEALLQSAGVFAGQDDECRLIKKKMDAEKKLADLDKDIMYLMKTIDGISTDDSGMKLTKNKSMGMEQFFVKKIWTKTPSSYLAGINNAQVYEVLRKGYTNVLELLEQIRGIGSDFFEITENELSKKETLKSLEEEADALRRSLSETENIVSSDDPEYEDPRRAALADSLRLCELGIAETRKELDALNKQQKDAKSRFNSCIAQYRQLVNCTFDTAKLAFQRVESIEQKQPSLADSVLEFESEFLNYKSLKGGADSSMDEFADTLDKMKSYSGMGGAKEAGIDFSEIRNTLSFDMNILEQAKSTLSSIKNPPQCVKIGDREALNSFVDVISRIEDSFLPYSFSGMNFDYSTLSFETENDSVSDALKGLAGDKLLGLVFPDLSRISENKCKEIEEVTEASCEIFDSEDASGFLDGVDSDVGSRLVGDAVDRILFPIYLSNHFLNLEGDGTAEYKPERLVGHVLNYEQEFFLGKHKSDRENLETAVMRLLFMRLPGSLIYCLTNAEVCAKAQEFATAVIGFAGLPFIVSFLKYLVIIVWATVQALVEVSAVVNGKKISLVTCRNIFCVDLEDIPKLSTELIKSKTEQMVESKGVPGYDEYLILLLLLNGEQKNTEGSMELVQINIRDKYSEDFVLGNCVCKAETIVEAEMPSKYIGGLLPDGSTLIVEKEYCY